MATTPEPIKGVPKLDGNPSFDLRGDFNALADWVRDNVDVAVANVAALPSSGNWAGRARWVLDENALYAHDGSGWDRVVHPSTPFAQAAGSMLLTSSFQTFNFPTGRFTVPPLVFLQLTSGSGSAVGNTSMVTGVTATSFQARQELSTSVGWAWHAIQMTPSSAAG